MPSTARDPTPMEPIVIVGAGPAGMMLAYQLASNGVPVRVLERHKDFDREFRGEFVQPSVMSVLEQLGILDVMRVRKSVAVIRAVRMHYGRRAFASNVGLDGGPAGQALHQPTLLELLHEQCARHACYRLDRGAKVTGLIREEGDGGRRTCGVVVRIGDREERIGSSLTVICNGRSSSLRKDVSAEVEELEAPYSILWLRFDISNSPELYPDTLDGFITKRAFCVLYPTYGQRVQLMWRRSRRHPLDWTKTALDSLREELLEDTPRHWHPMFESLNETTERQVLRVVSDRLRRWWAPGVLFLGDAAHTMSPIGGQGVSIAVRDAIVAANHLIPKMRERNESGGDPTIDDAILAAIEAERRPEIEKVQAFQTRAGRINDAPPVVQWLMAKLVIPTITKLQGESYLRGLQLGVTDVQMKFAVPITATVARGSNADAEG